MEASEIAVKFKSGENKILHITPIANIRTELKLFNAVFYLERTPLKNVILDPSLLAKQKRSKGIPKYEYAGCVCHLIVVVNFVINLYWYCFRVD